MLTYEQRVRVYTAIIITAVILFSVYFNILARTSLSDINLLNEIQTLTTAIERYKVEYSRYPAGDRISLRGTIYLTENGFAPGKDYLYVGELPTSKPVTFQSDQETYQLLFTLRKTWPNQGIYTKQCVMSSNAHLLCNVQQKS